MEKTADFTEGRILSRLLRFALPVLAALFLQAMYGAVDLMVVGQFGAPTDVSAVSTGQPDHADGNVTDHGTGHGESRSWWARRSGKSGRSRLSGRAYACAG